MTQIIEPLWTQDTPLREIQGWVEQHQAEGTTCPGCHQDVRTYDWHIPGSAVRTLVTGFGRFGMGWFKPSGTVDKKTRSFTKLQWWDLIEQSAQRGEDGHRGGYWRITSRGRDFLNGETSIPSNVLVLQGRRLRYQGVPVTIEEAVGSRFNLQEHLAASSVSR